MEKVGAAIMSDHRFPDVIVIGTGRSGTSAIARVCHERLGICMGHFLKERNEMNPQGFYEDWLTHSLIKMYLEKIIQIDELFRVISKSHAGCSSWGFKDPWWMFLRPDDMKLFNPRLIVMTQRNRAATIASWKKTRLNWAKAWNLKPPVDDPEELDKLMTKEFNNLLDQRRSHRMTISRGR
jgi:hypothetical protein